MVTLKLERAGKKAGLLNKMNVLVDDEQVGVLKRWGNAAEFDISPGSHVLTVKMMGARGSTEVELVDGETLDLQCGYPTFVGSMLAGMGGENELLAFWPRES